MGNLYVISAPSGTGKTTLVKAIAESLSSVMVSISHTTRPKRPLEKEGVNYYFISEKEFKEKIEHQDFLEYARVFKHFYGTSRTFVDETLATGKDVILEIDWQGAQQIQRLIPDSISVFILPPSFQALVDRLSGRDQDQSVVIQERLADVREAVSHIHEYNYVIVNDQFEVAVSDLTSIIQSVHLLERFQAEKYAGLVKELTSLEKYAGSITLKEDPLKYQKKIRDEW